ncbi:pyrophosphatase [Terribacillus saccharophilus]|uniref:Pyrophosphatase PpaX n=1 Tax=Terribacillus saccharophilus TaxID=361277 RepID=A0A075LQ41_9BACI|nr:pyrophosphatase PpaX [Terribacillus goriensis]AIF68087.1 pyrophosphatase [Terribacillus goriensis]
MSITTLLFDLDGTLIDSNSLILASYTATLEQYTGRTYEREELLPFIGPPLKDVFENIDPVRAEEMIAAYREHNLKHHDAYVEAYPYVAETLQQLKQAGFKLGIVTTKMRDTAERGLRVCGLGGLFDVVIGYDDITHAKPHPEPVLKGLDALGSLPEEAIMVGDNYHDIESGKNAGTKTAGVAWSIKGKQSLLAYGPDYMLEDIRDLLDIVKEEAHAENGKLSR